MPKIEIKPANTDDQRPAVPPEICITGDLSIITLPDRPVVAFFTEGTDALKQKLDVYLHKQTDNDICITEDEHGRVILDGKPVASIAFTKTHHTQVHHPHMTQDLGFHE